MFLFSPCSSFLFRYDIDEAGAALSSQDYIGFLECTLGAIVGHGGGSYTKVFVVFVSRYIMISIFVELQ